MSTAPNIQRSSNPAVLDGGQAGNIIDGSSIVPPSATNMAGTNILGPCDFNTTPTVNGVPVGVTGTVAASTLTGTVLATNVVTSSLTSLGTLSGLAVNGLIKPGVYAKASLPSATVVGQVIYVSDATRAVGTGSLCFAQATGTGGWIDVTTGIPVA